MDAVNSAGGYVDRALESEGHLRAPQVIVNGFGKRNYI